MSEYVKEVSDADFEKEVLESEKPVLVDFWAVWCGPCRMLAPTVDALAQTYSASLSVAKLNIDDNPNVPQRLGIKAIPTLIIFKGGQEAERIVGAVSKATLSSLLEKHIGAQQAAAPVASSQ